MSLKKDQDRVNEKAKYEFMQEIGIIPNEKKKNHPKKKNSHEQVFPNE